jgi:hypothetical protein
MEIIRGGVWGAIYPVSLPKPHSLKIINERKKERKKERKRERVADFIFGHIFEEKKRKTMFTTKQ